MSTGSCNKKASDLKCPCTTYYYSKGSFGGDGYKVDGVCTLTRKDNYYCRNATWEKSGKYRAGDPDSSCYHKSTLINVVGRGQKLIYDITSDDVLEVFDIKTGVLRTE